MPSPRPSWWLGGESSRSRRETRPCPGFTASPTGFFPTNGGTRRVVAGSSKDFKAWPLSKQLSLEVSVVGNEKYRLVIQASSRLRPIDQEVLRLTLWEEMSHADVAAVLGIGLAAVKQRAYRARRNLATEYQKLTNQPQPPAARKGGGS